MVHFRSPLYHVSASFLEGFSLSVHHQTFTSPAAQGDLTTLPDIALPMGHYPSSVKELIMAQAENRRKIQQLVFLRGTLRGLFCALCD